MVKINMMCGPRNFGPDWMHVDAEQYEHISSSDVYLLNSEPGTVDLIYCSHGISYFSSNDILPLLRQWWLALKPGGILRIATPDFKKLAALCLKGVSIDRLLGPLYGHMQSNGKHIQHQTCYDWESLTELLRQTGFTEWDNYDHRFTEHPNTGNREDRYDDHSSAYIDGVLISLNVECKKPE